MLTSLCFTTPPKCVHHFTRHLKKISDRNLFPRQTLPTKLANLTKHVQSRKIREKDLIFLSEPVPHYHSNDFIGCACQKIGLDMVSIFKPNTLKSVTFTNE